jgi:hypothetical protein
MRIEIDIPDWAVQEQRNLFIFAGMELVAYRNHGEEHWKVKIARCNHCGRCCVRVKCQHLVSDGPKQICALGSSRSFSCSSGVIEGRDGCTEAYVTVL